MAGYLFAEEGPLAGLVVRFEEGEEWIMGRDPDEASVVLEDPMVSRRHVICRLTPEGYLLENLSAVNPATQNGKVIAEPVLLQEGDIIQIGSTFFRFSKEDPSKQKKMEEVAAQFEEPSDLSSMSFIPETRWLLKVISGPNAGAEFNMQKSSVYLLGKDPHLCDIVFQDLSVSRQHARITVDDEENVYIEDLGSRNGVLVNAELIFEKTKLSSQDLVALGTTSFLVIDREQVRETIVSPPVVPIKEEFEQVHKEELAAAKIQREAREVVKRDWKEMIIPTKHLVIAGALAILVLIGITAMFSLFKTQTVVVKERNETEVIKQAIKNYPDVQITFNQSSGKLFITGHVLTGIEKQELMYILHNLHFITNIDDKIVVDEYVWQNMNALLATNSDWQGVSIHSPMPGRFVMRGYLQTPEQGQALTDYINRNFPYLDRLENQVVVENNMMTQISSMLIEKNFNGVTYQLTDGELVLAGRVDEKQTHQLQELVNEFKNLKGIRSVKNFIVVTTVDTSRIDLSEKYAVTGFSKRDESEFFVVINGRILTKGEKLDGMTITAVLPNMVLLEKDGLKFKINYNLQ